MVSWLKRTLPNQPRRGTLLPTTIIHASCATHCRLPPAGHPCHPARTGAPALPPFAHPRSTRKPRIWCAWAEVEGCSRPCRPHRPFSHFPDPPAFLPSLSQREHTKHNPSAPPNPAPLPPLSRTLSSAFLPNSFFISSHRHKTTCLIVLLPDGLAFWPFLLPPSTAPFRACPAWEYRETSVRSPAAPPADHCSSAPYYSAFFLGRAPTYNQPTPFSLLSCYSYSIFYTYGLSFHQKHPLSLHITSHLLRP